MKYLSKGPDINILELIVDKIEINPHSCMRGGMIEDGVKIKMVRYNLDDVLCQILEEYGEDEIINRIKEL